VKNEVGSIDCGKTKCPQFVVDLTSVRGRHGAQLEEFDVMLP
jgi:hypothetical protein